MQQGNIFSFDKFDILGDFIIYFFVEI